MSEEYDCDLRECPVCEQGRRFIARYSSGHERDSSADWEQCLHCGAYALGGTGDWAAIDGPPRVPVQVGPVGTPQDLVVWCRTYAESLARSGLRRELKQAIRAEMSRCCKEAWAAIPRTAGLVEPGPTAASLAEGLRTAMLANQPLPPRLKAVEAAVEQAHQAMLAVTGNVLGLQLVPLSAPAIAQFRLSTSPCRHLRLVVRRYGDRPRHLRALGVFSNDPRMPDVAWRELRPSRRSDGHRELEDDPVRLANDADIACLVRELLSTPDTPLVMLVARHLAERPA